ncbi:MAG TPA: GNAT family N-acetyltransferase [Hyphomicrobiaceae bacterium]|nr:GNAT family N-acetyltransferase [Hyphomicrobiaceae bacterium]
MIDRETDLLAIERAAVRGWPATVVESIDGWVARSSSGGSVRANSVAALTWTGIDLASSIARVVAFYRARHATPCFTVSDASAPPDLDKALDRAGWHRAPDHVTMAKWVGGGHPSVSPAMVVRQSDTPDEGWYDVYLQGLSADRRAIAPEIVERVPRPRVFFSAVRDGRVIGSGLSLIDGALASVQCMATLAEARRTGAATAILAAIEATARKHGCRRIYLQADGTNTPAIELYTRFGFTVVGRYHTRALTG